MNDLARRREIIARAISDTEDAIHWHESQGSRGYHKTLAKEARKVKSFWLAHQAAVEKHARENPTGE